MSSIPLVATTVQPQQIQDPLSEFARVLQIKGMQQQQQGQDTANQIGQLQLGEAQRASADDLKWRSALADPNWDGSPEGLLKAGLKQGVGPASYTGMATSLATMQSKYATLGSDQLKLAGDLQDHIGSQLQAIQAAPPSQKLSVQKQAKQNSIDWVSNTPGVPPQLKQSLLQGISQIPDDQYIGDDQLTAMIGQNKGAAGLIDNALKTAQTNKAATDAALNQIKINLTKNSKPGDFDSQIDSLSAPGTALNAQAKAMVNGALSRGDVDGAKQALDQTFQQVGAIAKETNPAVIAARAQGAAQTAIATEQARQKMYPAALAGVPPNLIQPASADATKADQAFTQAQQAGDEMQNMVKLAKAGNKVAYAYSPVTGVLQINVAGQVKRVNMPEIESYGAAGSALDNVKGFLGKQEAGKSIPLNVLNDMDTVSKMVTAGAQTKYQRDLASLNARYGAKFQPMNLPQQGGGTTFDVTDPRGVTHRFPTQQAADNFKKAAGIQ